MSFLHKSHMAISIRLLRKNRRWGLLTPAHANAKQSRVGKFDQLLLLPLLPVLLRFRVPSILMKHCMSLQ